MTFPALPIAAGAAADKEKLDERVLSGPEGFPRLFSVKITRDIATKCSSEWDILRGESRRVLDAADDTTNGIELSVVAYNIGRIIQIQQLQEQGVLTYEDDEGSAAFDDMFLALRRLQGISEDLSCYRTVDEIHASMDSMVEEYPDFVTVETIGESYLKSVGEGGDDIKVLVLSATSSAFRHDDGRRPSCSRAAPPEL